MNTAKQIAKHIRDVHFGGNWTSVNLNDSLADVSWEQATTQVHSLNTIATLVCHINYYIDAITKVLQGGALNAKDEHSFAHPPIHSPQDWENILLKLWADARSFTGLIEQLPEDKLREDFTDEKYGTYYRNLQGIIEHNHYHLGQIVLVKKILLQR